MARYEMLAAAGHALFRDSLVPRRLEPANAHAGMLLSVARRAREITSHVRAFRPSVLVACTGDPFDLPAAMLAAARQRLPLVVYLFDDPVFQWVPGRLRTSARWWEPIWSRAAAALIAPNEAMADAFTERRGKRPTIVRNPVPDEAFAQAPRPWPVAPGAVRIVYTGSVYHAQADAFANLIQALGPLGDGVSLHIYTSQSQEELQAHGVSGPRVHRHDHLDQAAVFATQQAADLLFLPLAFGSTIQDVLRTSAPAKMGEYLASGRPILVHAPSDTFIVRHFREHDCGTIVDRPDPAVVSRAIEELRTSPERRAILRDNALRLAERYRAGAARETFWGVIRTVSLRPA